MLLAGVELNPVPLIVTEVPMGPLVGVKLVITGCDSTNVLKTKIKDKGSKSVFMSQRFLVVDRS